MKAASLLVLALACGSESPPASPPPQAPALEPSTEPPVLANQAPRFPSWAEVRLVASGEVVPGSPYAAEWTLMWPEPIDDGQLSAYVILQNGEEVARIEPHSEGYDLGAVPEENRSYTIVAVDEGGLEGSLSFVLPATLDARMELTRRPVAGPPGSLRNGALGTPLGPGDGAHAQGTPVHVPSMTQRVAAEVTVGAPEVSGDGEFDTSIVRRTMRARLAAIKRCYETVLRAEPEVAGSITLRFTIVPRGTVRNASAVANTTGNLEVAQCVVQTARRFRFNPGPTADMTYEFPLTLAVRE